MVRLLIYGINDLWQDNNLYFPFSTAVYRNEFLVGEKSYNVFSELEQLGFSQSKSRTVYEHLGVQWNGYIHLYIHIHFYFSLFSFVMLLLLSLLLLIFLFFFNYLSLLLLLL